MATGGGTARSTGGGGGTGCSPKTCASQGKNCDSIPNGCGLSDYCGYCTAPETCGGAGTANVCGLSPGAMTVFVTLKWGISSGQSCSTAQPPRIKSCTATVSTTKDKFDTLRLIHGSCSTSQTASDAYTIDCSNDCTLNPNYIYCGAAKGYDAYVICMSFGSGCSGSGTGLVCSSPTTYDCTWSVF